MHSGLGTVVVDSQKRLVRVDFVADQKTRRAGPDCGTLSHALVDADFELVLVAVVQL